MPCNCQVVVKVFAPHLTFSDTHWWGCWGQGRKSKPPYLVFAARGGNGAALLFLGCGWRRVVTTELSDLLGYSFPSPLVRDSRPSLRMFSCVCWCFWVAGFSKIQSGIRKAERKPRTQCPAIPLFLRSLASLLLLSTFLSLLMFVLHTMFRVVAVLIGKKRQRWTSSDFSQGSK